MADDDTVTIEVPTGESDETPTIETGDTTVIVETPAPKPEPEPADDSEKDLAFLVGQLVERISALESRTDVAVETAESAADVADVAAATAVEAVAESAEPVEDNPPGKPHWFFRKANELRTGE